MGRGRPVAYWQGCRHSGSSGPDAAKSSPKSSYSAHRRAAELGVPIRRHEAPTNRELRFAGKPAPNAPEGLKLASFRACF